MSKFTGNWDDVQDDGFWDGWEYEDAKAAIEAGGWTEYTPETLPHPDHFESLNKDLKEKGLVMIWFWGVHQDPGDGGCSQMFDLPKD